MRTSKKKVRIHPRFYVILVLAIAGVSVGLYFLLGVIRREGELAVGTLRLQYDTKMVLLRDEKIVTVERFDKILFDVAEGAQVQEGEQIAQVFKWGYQEDTMQSLLDAQQKIYEYQLTLKEGIVDPELDAVQQQITQKQLEIRAAIQSEPNRDVLELEQELKTLLARRAELLRNVQPDAELTALYQQEEQQLTNYNSWKRDILNTIGPGVVSFYFDGNEQALDVQKLSMINADLIAEVIKGSGKVSSVDTTAESPLFRLVNSSHFYVAFLTDSSNPFRLVEGQIYSVVFNGYTDQQFVGTALPPVVTEKQVVNMLEFNQELGDLMGGRVVSASVMKDVTGLQVPLSAISMKEGVPGIMRIGGESTEWVAIDVLAKDDEYAIIQSAQPGVQLVDGLRYKKP